MWTREPPPPPPPARDDGATERTEPKRPWSKPSIRIMRVNFVTAGGEPPAKAGENSPHHLYTPAS